MQHRSETKRRTAKGKIPALDRRELHEIIALARESGFVTERELIEFGLSENDDFEGLAEALGEAGIRIVEHSAGSSVVSGVDSGDGQDEATAEAVIKRPRATIDPLSSYLGEMPRGKLLTREQEAALGRALEEGNAEIQRVLARFPGTAERLLERLDEAPDRERELSDVFASVAAADKKKNDAHIERLGVLYRRTVEAGAIHGLRHIETEARRRALAAFVQKLDLAPPCLDDLAERLHSAARRVRAVQRRIERLEFLDSGLCGRTPKAPDCHLLVGDADGCRASLCLAKTELLKLQHTLNIAGEDLAQLDRDLARAEAKVRSARDQMVLSNLRLVISIAKGFATGSMPLSDLIQEGNLGLMKAVEKFDYRLGHKFSTYATWWIRQGIMRALANKARVIRIPVHVVDQLKRVRRAIVQLYQETGGRPNIEEIARRVELSEEKVRSLIEDIPDVSSLANRLSEDDDTEFGDLVADEDIVTPLEHADEHSRRRLTMEALDLLPEREAVILRMRHGIDMPATYTLAEIGEQLGISRERARQLELKALKTLRKSAEAQRLLDPEIA